MKKIVITGGFGFIGKRFVNHFQSKNIEVIVMEHPDAANPLGFPNCEIIRADITSREFITKLKVNNVDAVLHLAAQSSGPKSFLVPEKDIKINIFGTLNIIDWMISNSISRILFASSFVVYGDHPNLEKLNEETPFKPKSVYASSKLSCEFLLKNYAQNKGIKWNALRMFNVYGPGQDITKPDQGLVGIFLNMIINQNKIEVKGSLERYRDLIHIEDVIQAWDKCLFSNHYNKSYNVGSGYKTTFKELINVISKVVGKKNKLKVVQIDGTPGDMMGCFADLTKISKDLDYEPKYTFKLGLINMFEWLEKSDYEM